MPLVRLFSQPSVADRLLALQQELDRVFEKPFGINLGLSSRGVFPPMNVFRDDKGIVIRLEAPGVAPDRLQIESHGPTLAVGGKRESAAPEGASHHRRERGSGEFSRSVQLPADVDPSQAEATYKNGMLTIRVPKRAELKPRPIAVRSA